MSAPLRLAPGEQLVWSGAPDPWRFALSAFRLKALGAYAVVVIALQVWRSVERGEGAVGAAPFALLLLAAFGVFVLLAVRMGRGVTYTVTTRRLVLTYGLALRATLSLPFARVGRISLAPAGDGTGDVLVELKPGGRLAYVKLWPLASGFWRRAGPRPLLRAVPDASLVGALMARAASAASQDDLKAERAVARPAAAQPEAQRCIA